MKHKNKKTILIVDDEAIIAMKEARTLEKQGYTVLIAHSGEDAIKAASQHPIPDLILMDIDLGSGMDGTRAAEIILKTLDIPVLFLSNHTEPEMVERTERITSYGYVVKNSGDTVLLASMKMAFKLHNAHLEMKEHEERFHELATFMPESVFETDAHGRITFVNQNSLDRFGYAMDEVIGRMTFLDVVDPGDHQRLLANVVKVRNGELLGLNEYNAVKKDGTRFPVLVNSTTIVRDGKTVGLRGFLVDITERKRAEQALRESEERFSELARLLPEVVFETDMQGKFTFVNQVGLDRFGYTMDDVRSGVNLSNVIVPEDRERALVNIGKMLQGEKLGLREYRVLRKDGSIFPVLVHSTAKIRDSAVVGLRGFLIDITERKKAEEALRESEERWQFALEGAGDGVWDWNMQTNKVHFSRQWKAMLGYDENEISDTLDEWDSRVHPDDRERAYADLNRHLEGKTPMYVNEHRVRCKNGEYKWILDRGKVINRTPDGGPLRVIGTHADITDRRQAEERYTTFMRNALDGFVIFDKRWRIVEGNEAYIQMTGYSREELMGIHISELEATLNIEEISSIYKTLQSRGSMRFETRHKKKDGTAIDVEVSIRLQEDEKQNNQTFVIIRDISEKKKAEAALENSVREKEALFHELQHRTKNNLNMITSLISLEMNRPESAGSWKILESLKGRIMSVTDLYTLLSMSDVAARVNLDEYIQSIASSVAATYVSGMSTVTIEKECERVSANPKDATAWGLIANELLTNALKYAFPAGASGAIRVSLRKTDGSIELAVSDNGPGPAADFDIERPKGFGLLLVNMLTRQLGGVFAFERGSENVFSVRVPAPPAGRGPGVS